MKKRTLCLISLLLLGITISSLIYAQGPTVFGPKQFTISWLRIHLSFNQFIVDDPGDGVATITKSTPDLKLTGGFVLCNRSTIQLREFFRRGDTNLEKAISLRATNRLMVLLWGQPKASISLQIRKENPIEQPPEVTISAVPESIHIGESSTLTWTTTNAYSASIDHGIGSVDLSGSTPVSPTETTTYIITATGSGGESTDSVTVTVVNSPPVADSQAVSTDEDASVSITLTGSDADGDPITFQVVTAPANGTLSGTAPDLTYAPNENYNGPDSFTFKVDDGHADSEPATVSIQVDPVNDVPKANDQTMSLNEDEALSITLSGSDIDGDPLNYLVIASPFHGTLTGSAPNLTYTPGENYNGSDSFTFKVNDGAFDSETATVAIQVMAVNDPPVAVDDEVTTNKETLVITGNVLANDTDVDGDTLTISGFTHPTNGTAINNGDGTFTYTPNSGFHGEDNFTYTASDGNGGTASANVTVTVLDKIGPPTVRMLKL
ncbi:MAG: tandem-95 repeat protein [Deltaproteobacteria bacterium]|nr:MAG: tandem-95 repeat protein [Deltaproteobacteria bacterium]